MKLYRILRKDEPMMLKEKKESEDRNKAVVIQAKDFLEVDFLEGLEGDFTVGSMVEEEGFKALLLMTYLDRSLEEEVGVEKMVFMEVVDTSNRNKKTFGLNLMLLNSLSEVLLLFIEGSKYG